MGKFAGLILALLLIVLPLEAHVKEPQIKLVVLIPRDFEYDPKWDAMLSQRWQGVLDWYAQRLGRRLNAQQTVLLQSAPWTLAEIRYRTVTVESGMWGPRAIWQDIQREVDQTTYGTKVVGVIAVGASGFRGAWHDYKWGWTGFSKKHYFAVGDIVFTSWLSVYPESGVTSQVATFWPGFIEDSHTPDAMSGIVAHELAHGVADQGEHVCDNPLRLYNPPLYCLMNVPVEWPNTEMGETVRNKILARKELLGD